MFSNLLHRNPRDALLVEINPYQVLIAGIRSIERGPILVHKAAEFDRNDDAGLRRWLESNFDGRKSRIPAICGYVPSRGLLRRETVEPGKLADRAYLADLVREQFKVENPEAWQFQVLSPIDGTPLPHNGTPRPALLCGISNEEIFSANQRLVDHRLVPMRMQLGLLSLLGAMMENAKGLDAQRCPVVVVIEVDQTAAYILGKEGVHPLVPIGHGIRSIVLAARKELGLAEDSDWLSLLRNPSAETRLRASNYMRAIGRELKPQIDSYEMSTGQLADGIYCAYLPPDLAWIAEPLAKVVDRHPIDMDCRELLTAARLQAEGGVAEFGAHWFGALSLLAEFSGARPAGARRFAAPNNGRWQADCRLSADIPDNRVIGRRFVSGLIVAALVAFVVTLTVWQAYAISSLRTDTQYWETELSKNQGTFDELKRSMVDLRARSARLDCAYNLMASPYQVSDFVLNLGRTRPRNVRIDVIEANRVHITVTGGLHEPSEAASATLNRYLEELRRNPAIGPLFSSIGLTALQRDEDTDSMSFEITFKLKVPQP